MKKILLYFQQTGGANALLPLIESWQSRYEIIITGRRLVAEGLRRRGVDAHTYEPGLKGGHASIFRDMSPDMVITDTINLMRVPDGTSCRSFWLLAKERGIPSVAYVDCWWGYRDRFMLAGERRPRILPDYIAVVDSIAKKGMIEAGFDSEKISTLGSPKFAELARLSVSDKNPRRAPQKEVHGNELDTFTILFVSQPLEKVLGSSKAYGFTEKTTFAAILDLLAKYRNYKKVKIVVIVLLHPEEDEVSLKAIASKNRKHEAVDTVFVKMDDPLKMILSSDLVIGMSSILLTEAVILKRPVLSVQLNMNYEEILVTNIIGATLSVNSYEELENVLFNAITNKRFRASLLDKQRRFSIVTDACLRWNNMVKALLNGERQHKGVFVTE